ncbi:hypothetical protein D4Q85_00035 [bacterium]|nr:MAG: hypothetical protein D4Q85_00035 [bacterium]
MSQPHCRRGFTLIEAVLAAGVTGILLASVGSIISLCAKALPDSASDKALVAASTQDGLSMLADDLTGAISIASASSTDLTFRVNNPASPGTISLVRYWWDGTAGTPLRRTWDGRAEIAVIPALRRYELSYDWRTTSTSTMGSTSLATASQLAQCVGASGSTFTLGLVPRFAQIVTPRLDGEATTWKPTRVRANVSLKSGLVSSIVANLYLGDSSNLGSQSLIATSTTVTALSGARAGWMDFDFSGAPEVAAGQSVTVVLGALVLLGTAEVTYTQSGIADSLACCATSSNGSTWSIKADGSLAYELFGQVRGPSIVAGSEQRLASVGVDLLASGAGSSPAHGRVRTPALPKVE